MTHLLYAIPRKGRSTWTPYATEAGAVAAMDAAAQRPELVYVAVYRVVDGVARLAHERDLYAERKEAA